MSLYNRPVKHEAYNSEWLRIRAGKLRQIASPLERGEALTDWWVNVGLPNNPILTRKIATVTRGGRGTIG